MPGQDVGARTTARTRGKLLAVCRAVGWFLGLLVAIAFLLTVHIGRQVIVTEQRHSLRDADDFIARVKACRRQAAPTPSWSACETRVRSRL